MSIFDSAHWFPFYDEETRYRQSLGEDLFRRLAWDCNYYAPRNNSLIATNAAQQSTFNAVIARGANCSTLVGCGGTQRASGIMFAHLSNGTTSALDLYPIFSGWPPVLKYAIHREGNEVNIPLPTDGRPLFDELRLIRQPGDIRDAWVNVAQPV